ncbi:MAG: MBL fold metallo-hydrolase [Nanobdellota archaeon]
MKEKKITKDVIKFSGQSNVFLLNFEEKIIIDAGVREEYQELKGLLSKYTQPSSISKVLLTHLHYDHVGNIDLFKNARIFASKNALNSFRNDSFETVLNQKIAQLLKNFKIEEIHDMNGLKILYLPGHTKGSIALWYEKENILFSGDTIFSNDLIGRTDLPTSEPEQMKATLQKLNKYSQSILCPGHDY